MPSPLKKKSKAAELPLVPPWHPNFRNYEKLPDIKVVRTAFFINGAAITVALALAVYFGTSEWQLRAVNAQIADTQRQIDHDKPASDQAVALFKKYQAEETRIRDVDAFVKSKPIVSDLLLRLAATLPSNVAFDSVELHENGLKLLMTVRGSPDVATGYATAYLEQLRADQVLAQQFEEPAFTNQAPNAVTGRLTVEFFLRLKK